jgi:hypothetical protein
MRVVQAGVKYSAELDSSMTDRLCFLMVGEGSCR